MDLQQLALIDKNNSPIRCRIISVSVVTIYIHLSLELRFVGKWLVCHNWYDGKTLGGKHHHQREECGRASPFSPAMVNNTTTNHWYLVRRVLFLMRSFSSVWCCILLSVLVNSAWFFGAPGHLLL